MKLSIVIPVYNEEDNIEILYKKIIDVLKKINYEEYEIIFVDDGSRDNTPKIFKKLYSENNKINVITFKRNFGQTAAIAAGIENSTGDIIITMDGDGQNDPESISELLNKLDEGYELVAGWRKDRKDNLFYRKIPSIIANKLISISTKVPIHDHGCTMKIFTRSAINDIALYGEQHRFITVLIAWSGVKYTEIPVKHNARIAGKSKYGLIRVFKVFFDLYTLIILRSYATKPIYIFGTVGLISFLFFIVSISAALYQKHLWKISILNNPLAALSSLFFILGIMFFLIGLMAEILVRIYYESTGKNIYLVKEKLIAKV